MQSHSFDMKVDCLADKLFHFLDIWGNHSKSRKIRDVGAPSSL